MEGTSTRLTMGTALSMAEAVSAPVKILVGGQWIEGRMGKKDDQGVSILVEGSVVGSSYNEWAVIKFDQIQVVRIPADLEQRPQIEAV